jgi:hypothetical protein
LVNRVLAANAELGAITGGSGTGEVAAGANSKSSTEPLGIAPAGCDTRAARPNLEEGFFIELTYNYLVSIIEYASGT